MRSMLTCLELSWTPCLTVKGVSTAQKFANIRAGCCGVCTPRALKPLDGT